MRIPRRILAPAAVRLTLGLLTTIAVAWGCAAWCLVGMAGGSSTRSVPSLVDGTPEIASFGDVTRHIDPDWLPWPKSSDKVTAHIGVQHGFGLRDTTLIVEYQPERNGMDYGLVFSHYAGWPMLALGCSWTLRGETYVPESGWLPPRSIMRHNYAPTSSRRPPLPMAPYAPGLVADTAFYACLWSLLLFAPRAIRTRLRRRRNLCPRCGYSRAGLAPDSACPECGRAC